jgi:hypothetical protein
VWLIGSMTLILTHIYLQKVEPSPYETERKEYATPSKRNHSKHRLLSLQAVKGPKNYILEQNKKKTTITSRQIPLLFKKYLKGIPGQQVFHYVDALEQQHVQQIVASIY